MKHNHGQITINKIIPQRFHSRLNRGHGSAHTHILRNAKGMILGVLPQQCVNSLCELNGGKEQHHAS